MCKVLLQEENGELWSGWGGRRASQRKRLELTLEETMVCPAAGERAFQTRAWQVHGPEAA